MQIREQSIITGRWADFDVIERTEQTSGKHSQQHMLIDQSISKRKRTADSMPIEQRGNVDVLPDGFRCSACPLVERVGIAALGTKPEARTERIMIHRSFTRPVRDDVHVEDD